MIFAIRALRKYVQRARNGLSKGGGRRYGSRPFVAKCSKEGLDGPSKDVGWSWLEIPTFVVIIRDDRGMANGS